MIPAAAAAAATEAAALSDPVSGCSRFMCFIKSAFRFVFSSQCGHLMYFDKWTCVGARLMKLNLHQFMEF